MASNNNKSGTSQKEREKFLRDHGFILVRNGKGSHDVWEHPGIKHLAAERPVGIPGNLMQSPHQKPWEAVLPDNPGPGLWHKIEKHAEWCSARIEELSHQQVRVLDAQRLFRENMKEFCDWKRDAKHAFKAGVPIPKAPSGCHRPPIAPKP